MSCRNSLPVVPRKLRQRAALAFRLKFLCDCFTALGRTLEKDQRIHNMTLIRNPEFLVLGFAFM